ncbi:MAG: ribulose-phosphate 3-epimerase [Clostridia bacterium]|nr:ribulose-phosphate 3-epimerase [Clostridia bacterium]
MQELQKYSQKKAAIAPSLICVDLCNIERDVRRLEAMGCEMLHVDVLDGRYSPSMPIGLDTIRQLRKRTQMDFDVHIMSVANEYFVDEMLDIGAQRLCFQLESQPTPGPLLHRIRSKGCAAGLALAPSTPISSLEYLIEDCDFVLLMQIDPGYASFSGTAKEPYMQRKAEDLYSLIEKYHPEATVTVDGRVDFASMPALLRSGVQTFVSGTRGVFHPGASWEENWQRLWELIRREGGE